jgi:antitoxin component YwqK of YwqJK toxin-antitoxin module
MRRRSTGLVLCCLVGLSAIASLLWGCAAESKYEKETAAPLDKNYTGVWRTHYRDGKPRAETPYKNGLRHGAYTGWHDNGQKAEEGSFTEGKPTGIARTWDYEGKLTSTLDYQTASGKRCDSSPVKREVELKYGKVDTVNPEWYLAGADPSAWRPKDDPEWYMDGAYTVWHPNGQKSQSGRYVKNARDGQWTTWDAKGEVLVSGVYKNGKPWDGTFHDYFDYEGFSMIGTFKDGVRVGDLPEDVAGKATSGAARTAPVTALSKNVDVSTWKRVRRNGMEVWANTTTKWPAYGDKIYVSPDERFLAMPHYVCAGPMLVVNMATGFFVKVDVPPGAPESHYNVYPFQFNRWSADSSSIIVYVLGSDGGGPTMIAYREIWSIDPNTGVAKRLSRQTQHWVPNPQWKDESDR